VSPSPMSEVAFGRPYRRLDARPKAPRSRALPPPLPAPHAPPAAYKVVMSLPAAGSAAHGGWAAICCGTICYLNILFQIYCVSTASALFVICYICYLLFAFAICDLRYALC
jgi:hypothetical protein